LHATHTDTVTNFMLPLQVNMIKDDGTVIHFNNPKVQASLGSNVFAVTGHGETKGIVSVLKNVTVVPIFCY